MTKLCNFNHKKISMFNRVLVIILILLMPAQVFAEGAHHGPALWILWVNYVIFVSFMFYALKKPLSAMWAKRGEDWQDSILKAERELEAAEKKLAEAKAQSENANQEIAQLQSNIKNETDVEVKRIAKEASAQAERITSLANKNADAELEMELQKTQDNFADKVCELAKARLEKEFDNQLDAQYRKSGLSGIKSIIN